ncbi:unnamed protein product [Sordaria macrospora k-hell]|uniref:WGS project CABT00000000 data, contig 2.2 n=1 Tax=Sordaria macrospora (strain ATCC MYA-333 / DSM 997 / K(L3346) / K-hell) TaxID=771870 RepID=F7VMB2_SORMK|nr:uncharacterized protein SMAC_01116 [Sordaria macrospora k-hell]CCC07092.1 unnamed protein product [Sordaria macrospora k-hell]
MAPWDILGDWVNQNLPIAAETLADILDNAKKHAEHVSIQLIWSGAPKNSQVILGNDGETVELVRPSNPTTWIDSLTYSIRSAWLTNSLPSSRSQLLSPSGQRTFSLGLLRREKNLRRVPGSSLRRLRSGQSIAAAIHSTIGNVSPGSVFAFLQSAGAEGYGAVALDAALRTAGATIMTAGAADLIRQWMEKFNGEVPVIEMGGL